LREAHCSALSSASRTDVDSTDRDWLKLCDRSPIADRALHENNVLRCFLVNLFPSGVEVAACPFPFLGFHAERWAICNAADKTIELTCCCAWARPSDAVFSKDWSAVPTDRTNSSTCDAFASLRFALRNALGKGVVGVPRLDDLGFELLDCSLDGICEFGESGLHLGEVRRSSTKSAKAESRKPGWSRELRCNELAPWDEPMFEHSICQTTKEQAMAMVTVTQEEVARRE
jgi:hypothetical protein